MAKIFHVILARSAFLLLLARDAAGAVPADTGISLAPEVSTHIKQPEGRAALIRRDEGTRSLDISEAGTMKAQKQEHSRSGADEAMYLKRDSAWTQCASSGCKCASRRRMVIRYKPLANTADPITGDTWGTPECQSAATSWYFVQHTTAYVETPVGSFNMGFTSAAKIANMSTCGNVGGSETICPTVPDNCHMDTEEGGNPYDAQVGQYCCDSTLGYCSYRCQELETFKCPKYDPNNVDPSDGYPGGFDVCPGANPTDPTDKGWPKACFMAQYEDGHTPSDGSLD